MKPFQSLAPISLCSSQVAAGLIWGNCSASDPPGLQCAQLKVPLNWAEPHGEKTTFGLSRLKALDPANRIGSLLFNPGGPRNAASDWVEGQARGAPFFTEALMSRFDLIGMDPRGIGTSTPIKCDPASWNGRVSYFPTEEEFAAMVAHNKAFGESCLKLTGPLLGYIDTTSVAHDLEAVCLALGEGKMNYLGISYGSQLGTQYAELYPDNIRVMALDGNLDHSQSEVANHVIEASTYELVFKRFAEWCSDTSACTLSGRTSRIFLRNSSTKQTKLQCLHLGVWHLVNVERALLAKKSSLTPRLDWCSKSPSHS